MTFEVAKTSKKTCGHADEINFSLTPEMGHISERTRYRTIELSEIVLNSLTLLFALMAYLMYKKYTRVAEENMNILKKDLERESAIKKEALIAAKEAVKSERERLIEETRDRRQEF